jgi:MoaA/NifB/PqqE/SkfB family radical SAM enzyme
MYCPVEWHDNTSDFLDLETMKQAWRNIHSKTCHKNLGYKISLLGGELCANKNFLSLVKWMRDEYPDISAISITTNGSASLNYYLRLVDLVEYITFSLHSEHVDEQDFFYKIDELRKRMEPPKQCLHVNVMDEFWNQDRIPKYQQWLTSRNINHSVNVIDYSKQTRTYPIMKGNLNLG